MERAGSQSKERGQRRGPVTQPGNVGQRCGRHGSGKRQAVHQPGGDQQIAGCELDAHAIPDFDVDAGTDARAQQSAAAVRPQPRPAALAGCTARAGDRLAHFDIGMSAAAECFDPDDASARVIHHSRSLRHPGRVRPRRPQRRRIVDAICTTVSAGTWPTAVTWWSPTTALNAFDEPTLDAPLASSLPAAAMNTETLARPSL